jgi:hypothetical protein
MLWRSDPGGKACNSRLTVACLDSRKSLQDNNIYIRNLPGHHPLRLGPFAPVLDSKSTVRPTTGSVRERPCRSRSLFPADYPSLVTNGSSSRSAARISASSDLNSPRAGPYFRCPERLCGHRERLWLWPAPRADLLRCGRIHVQRKTLRMRSEGLLVCAAPLRAVPLSG